MKILLVCIGNICRSPMAEYILKSKIDTLKLPHNVASAGVEGHHVGQGANVNAIQTAKKHGINLLPHKAQQLTKLHFEEYDKIYVFANDVMQAAINIAPTENSKQKLFFFTSINNSKCTDDIIDPWYFDATIYAKVYNQIEELCELLVENDLKNYA